MSDFNLNEFAKELNDILTKEDNKKSLRYQWRRLSKMELPVDISLETRSILQKISCNKDEEADQLVKFRIQFSERWNALPSSKNEERKSMLRWVVRTWGGIRRLSDGKLSDFITMIENQSLCDDNKLISSKSKCWSFVDPENRFVYDSRVALALNTVILKKFNDCEWQFFMPNGRSNAFREFVSNWSKKPNIITYDTYCELIKHIAELQNLKPEDRQRIELQLFMMGRNIGKFKF